MELAISLGSGTALLLLDSISGELGKLGRPGLCNKVILGRPPNPEGADGSILALLDVLAISEAEDLDNLFLLDALAANKLFKGLIPEVCLNNSSTGLLTMLGVGSDLLGCST